MAALVPTGFEGRVVWLGYVPHRDRAEIDTVPLAEMRLEYGGFSADCHAGLTRPSCSRVLAQYPRRGTEIRNTRQLSLASVEDLAEIAEALGLERVLPEWIGASVVVEGIPDFSHLPPSSRLQGPDGVTVTVDIQNRPCRFPARTIESARPGHGSMFQKAAKGRRGVTGWVEREGTLRVGDRLRLHIPDQRPWACLDAARKA
jgi:hypothetical protein